MPFPTFSSLCDANALCPVPEKVHISYPRGFLFATSSTVLVISARFFLVVRQLSIRIHYSDAVQMDHQNCLALSLGLKVTFGGKNVKQRIHSTGRSFITILWNERHKPLCRCPPLQLSCQHSTLLLFCYILA